VSGKADEYKEKRNFDDQIAKQKSAKTAERRHCIPKHMKRDGPAISEERHQDLNNRVMRFTCDAAADSRDRCERDMCERRKNTAHHKDQCKSDQTAAAERTAVIKNVFDGRKPKCDNTRENNAVQNIVEIFPEREQKYQQADAFRTFFDDRSRQNRADELARVRRNGGRYG